MKKVLSKKGDKKIVTKFLLFPKIINYEFRWLEFASWEKERLDNYYWPNKWNDVQWKN